jgi:hypothetical protein
MDLYVHPGFMVFKKFPWVTPADPWTDRDRGEARGCKVHPTNVSHKSPPLGATVVKQLPSCYNSWSSHWAFYSMTIRDGGRTSSIPVATWAKKIRAHLHVAFPVEIKYTSKSSLTIRERCISGFQWIYIGREEKLYFGNIVHALLSLIWTRPLTPATLPYNTWSIRRCWRLDAFRSRRLVVHHKFHKM